jgi:hypothetical protein
MKIAVPLRLVQPNKNRGDVFEPYFTDDPQAQGSAISYARRYSLQSMVFIPAQDDDAEKATKHDVSTDIDKTAPAEKSTSMDSSVAYKCSECGTTNKFHRKDCPNA